MAIKTAKKTHNSTRALYDSAASTPERKVELTTTIIVAAVTMAIGVLVGINANHISNGVQQALGQKTTTSVDFSSLDDLYEELSENFDGEIDKTKIIEEAKRGLVNGAGDKYTYYMTKTESEEFEKELEGDVGAGIGVEIGERDGVVKVLRTTPDNPARKPAFSQGILSIKRTEKTLALSVLKMLPRSCAAKKVLQSS